MNLENWWKGTDREKLKYLEKNLPQFNRIHMEWNGIYGEQSSIGKSFFPRNLFFDMYMSFFWGIVRMTLLTVPSS
jgi:hypothetical protein